MSALEMTAASSFQEVGCTGTELLGHASAQSLDNNSTRSTKAALGTCSPPPVPETKASNSFSFPPKVLSLGG